MTEKRKEAETNSQTQTDRQIDRGRKIEISHSWELKCLCQGFLCPCFMPCRMEKNNAEIPGSVTAEQFHERDCFHLLSLMSELILLDC